MVNQTLKLVCAERIPTFNKTQEEPRKNWFDKVVDYICTSDGIADAFGLMENGLDYIQKLPLRKSYMETCSKIQNMCSVAGGAIVFPDIVSGLNTMGKSIVLLKNKMFQRNATKDECTKTTVIVKKIFKQTLSLLGNGSKAAMYLQENQILDFGKKQTIFNGLFNTSFLIIDSFGIYEKAKNILNIKAKTYELTNNSDVSSMKKSFNLQLMKLIQKVSSVALCLIGLVAILFDFNLKNPGLLAYSVIILTTAYISLNLSIYFYSTNKHQTI